MKGPEISLQKNLIKQGTLSLERRDAVGEGWDGVFNYQMSCMWKNIFFYSGWPQWLDLGRGESSSLRMRMSLSSMSTVSDDGVCCSVTGDILVNLALGAWARTQIQSQATTDPTSATAFRDREPARGKA